MNEVTQDEWTAFEKIIKLLKEDYIEMESDVSIKASEILSKHGFSELYQWWDYDE